MAYSILSLLEFIKPNKLEFFVGVLGILIEILTNFCGLSCFSIEFFKYL